MDGENQWKIFKTSLRCLSSAYTEDSGDCFEENDFSKSWRAITNLNADLDKVNRMIEPPPIHCLPRPDASKTPTHFVAIPGPRAVLESRETYLAFLKPPNHLLAQHAHCESVHECT